MREDSMPAGPGREADGGGKPAVRDYVCGCTWAMSGYFTVKAVSPEDAYEAIIRSRFLPIPEDAEAIEGTFELGCMDGGAEAIAAWTRDYEDGGLTLRPAASGIVSEAAMKAGARPAGPAGAAGCAEAPEELRESWTYTGQEQNAAEEKLPELDGVKLKIRKTPGGAEIEFIG